MKINSWIANLSKILLEFEAMDIGYPKGQNKVIRRIEKDFPEVEISLPRIVRKFYTEVNQVLLPDIYTGYFLISLENIISRSQQGELPTFIQRKNGLESIISFGTSGGGDIFAVAKKQDSPVYLLPIYGITGGKFDANIHPIYIVAEDFETFLNRLLNDAQAFVQGKTDWDYLTDIN